MQMAERGFADAVERRDCPCRRIEFAARIECQRMTVTVERAAERMLVGTHADTPAVDVLSQAEDLANIGVIAG